MKLYESQAVGEAGAEAIAQGNEIAFAPGMADFSTRSGQERLGHELSHVMSQRSGQVRGQGFLADSALEARADREGARAAAGQQVYTGPVTHTLSDASPSPMAAGAMQAKRRDKDALEVKDMQKSGKNFDDVYATPDYAKFNTLNEDEWETKTHTPNFFSKIFGGKKDQTYKVRKNLYVPPSEYKRFANTPELNPLHIEKQTRNFDTTKIPDVGIGDHRSRGMDEYVPSSIRPDRDDLYKQIVMNPWFAGTGLSADIR